MLFVAAAQAAWLSAENGAAGVVFKRKKLILGAKIAGLAAIEAIEQAVKAQPNVVLAKAPGAVAEALAAVLCELALHADVASGHWFQCRCKRNTQQLTYVMTCSLSPRRSTVRA